MTIGIMSAMPEELEALVSEIRGQATKTTIGKRDYYQGNLWGKPTVLVFSRWGKVAAATTATCLITRFQVDTLLFTGVAGGADPSVHIGDIVIASGLYQHDMDASPLFSRHEIPLLNVSDLHTDPDLRALAAESATTFVRAKLRADVKPEILQEFHIREPQVRVGEIASGDKFFAKKEELSELKKRLPSVLCVEMEGAAVGQVCYEYEIPFAIIRTISDSADEEAPVNFPKFIHQVASVYSHGILKELYERLGRGSN